MGIKIKVDNHLDPFTATPTRPRSVSVEFTHDPLTGIDWVIDPALPNNLIYVIDPDSLYIENGIVKFKGKYVKMPNKLQKHGSNILGHEIPQKTEEGKN